MRRVQMLVVLSLSACTPSYQVSADSQDVFSRAVSVCTLVANSQDYDGRKLLVRAVYRMALHGAVLVGDKSCPSSFVVWRKSAGYKENDVTQMELDALIRSREGDVADVVYRGTFRLIVGGFECSATTYCSNLVLETSELVAARPPN